MKNPIEDMTQFELNAMYDYLELNDILFEAKSDELDELFKSVQSIVTTDMLNNPNVMNEIRNNYIILASELIDEIRTTLSSSTDIVAKITKTLNRYYDMVFSRLGMVNATNGQISSIDICKNYFNCELYCEQLQKLFEVKRDLKRG